MEDIIDCISKHTTDAGRACPRRTSGSRTIPATNSSQSMSLAICEIMRRSSRCFGYRPRSSIPTYIAMGVRGRTSRTSGINAWYAMVCSYLQIAGTHCSPEHSQTLTSAASAYQILRRGKRTTPPTHSFPSPPSSTGQAMTAHGSSSTLAQLCLHRLPSRAWCTQV